VELREMSSVETTTTTKQSTRTYLVSMALTKKEEIVNIIYKVQQTPHMSMRNISSQHQQQQQRDRRSTQRTFM